jgi:hypothetical protein
MCALLQIPKPRLFRELFWPCNVALTESVIKGNVHM